MQSKVCWSSCPVANVVLGLGLLYQYTFLELDQAAKYLIKALELDPKDVTRSVFNS